MTNTEIAQRETEIQARLEAATPGEWIPVRGCEVQAVNPYGHGNMEVADLKGTGMWGHVNGWSYTGAGAYDRATAIQRANAEFIANAKSDLTWQRERIKELVYELADCINDLYDLCDILRRQRVRINESKAELENSNKWSKRWKRLAKRTIANLLFAENVKLRNRIKELEKESDIWDKQSLVEMVTRSKSQAEQIKALEAECARLGEAFETELWDKTTYLDLSEVQQERIKELETENDDLKLECSVVKGVVKLSDSNLNRAYERRKMLQYELSEQRAMLENSNKWSQRWKKVAKEYRWGIIATERLLFDTRIRAIDKTTDLCRHMIGMTKRMSALENAARSCPTCVHYTNVEDVTFSQTRCATCDGSVSVGREKLTNWEFAEERFVPMEGAGK